MSGKTNGAWAKLFEEYNIRSRLDEDGIFFISASQINRYRQARLMTKFDSSSALPTVLSKANVGILPVKNGRYALIREDMYHRLSAPHQQPEVHSSSRINDILTIPWRHSLSSESQAIDLTFLASILSSFTGDSLTLTIRGRRRAPRFSFRVGTHHLEVEGVQIEVDSGYEGKNAVYLIEAKNGEREDFIVRQLFYPFRMWQSVLNGRKKIVPIFLTYSNRVFTLRRYCFLDPHDYGSIKLVDSRSFTLDSPSTMPSIEEVLRDTRVTNLQTGIPFPQADNILNVIDIVDAVAAGVNRKEDFSDRHDYTDRQADYYANAAAYLGLVERGEEAGQWTLTSKGRLFAESPRFERIRMLLDALTQSPGFRESLVCAAKTGRLPSREDVARYLEAASDKGLIKRLGSRTPLRRARTVLSWLEWLLDMIQDARQTR